MKRLTILTGMVLTLVFCLLQLTCADSLQVSLRDVLLSDREAILTLENKGGQDLLWVWPPLDPLSLEHWG